MSEGLVVWLRAQLDEDEQIARTAGGTWWAPPDLVGEVHDSGGVNIDAKLKSFAAHIEAWDPARVLREIDAKRQILDLHRPVQRRSTGSGGGIVEDCQICGHFPAQYPCPTLRLLVLPYANRPGYRDEWRP